MITDALLEFDHDYVLTASAASTNSVDQGAAGDALDGSQLWLVARCGTLLNSAGNGATFKLALQHDSATGFGGATDAMSVSILEAVFVANTVFWAAKLPKGLLRYLRCNYTVSGENFTTGTIDVFLTPNIDVLFA